MGDLLLLRHGETAWTLSRQHTSHTDLPLTPHGEEAARVAHLLRGHDIALALSSPCAAPYAPPNWPGCPVPRSTRT